MSITHFTRLLIIPLEIIIHIGIKKGYRYGILGLKINPEIIEIKREKNKRLIITHMIFLYLLLELIKVLEMGFIEKINPTEKNMM